MFQVSEAETIITKRSILDVAAALDPPLRFRKTSCQGDKSPALKKTHS